jgi:hypothetical protein
MNATGLRDRQTDAARRLAFSGLRLTKTVKSSSKIVKRKPGRPATGMDPLIGFRLPAETIAAIDAWAASQPDRPTRSEALRRFIEAGMKVLGAAQAKRKPRPTVARGR